MTKMSRTWHHWETWECVDAGMYDSSLPDGMNIEEARSLFADFFRGGQFENGIKRVFREWPIACEHFLTASTTFNRIAWLGQAAVCITIGLPRICRGGFLLLTAEEREEANGLAAKYIAIWEAGYRKKSSALRTGVESSRLLGRDTGHGPRRIDAGELGAIVQGYLFSLAEE